MQSNGSVIRGQEILPPTHAWEMIREWASRHIKREGTLDATLTFGTFGLIGFIILILHKAFQNYPITGF